MVMIAEEVEKTIAAIARAHRTRGNFHRTEKGLITRITAMYRPYVPPATWAAADTADKRLALLARIRKAAQVQCATTFKAYRTGDAEATALAGLRVPDDDGFTFVEARMDTTAIVIAWCSVHAARLVQEAQIEDAARRLPVWPWVESVKGFGALGLGQIIGEAGDLHHYPNPAKLWKRMGIGIVGATPSPEGSTGGQIQRRVTDKELAILMGYVAERRSLLFNIGDSLMKSRRNRYRDVYDERKRIEEERHPDLSKLHRHRRALRYMEKLLLKNLWQEWRQVTPQ